MNHCFSRVTAVLMCCLLVFYFPSSAQKYLYLSKDRGIFECKFKVGERMAFKQVGSDFVSIGHITAFGEASIFFQDLEIPLDSISEIDLRRKKFTGRDFSRVPGKLLFASVAYPGIDWINQGRFPSQRVFVSAAIIAGTGVFFAIATRKKFIPGGKYKMEIIEKSPVILIEEEETYE